MNIGEQLLELQRLHNALSTKSAPRTETLTAFNGLILDVEAIVQPMGLEVIQAKNGIFCLIAQEKRK